MARFKIIMRALFASLVSTDTDFSTVELTTRYAAGNFK